MVAVAVEAMANVMSTDPVRGAREVVVKLLVPACEKVARGGNPKCKSVVQSVVPSVAVRGTRGAPGTECEWHKQHKQKSPTRPETYLPTYQVSIGDLVDL